ncbi:MAG: hypothetical protein ACLGIF_02205 [Actinomycetes bacterium]
MRTGLGSVRARRTAALGPGRRSAILTARRFIDLGRAESMRCRALAH